MTVALTLAAAVALALPSVCSAQRAMPRPDLHASRAAVIGGAAVPLVLRGVTVIDVQNGRRLPAQTVVIVGNRIRRVGPASGFALPKRAHVIEAQGKYLIPGLWDMHVHPMGAVDVFYPLFIAYGVTGVRDAGSSVPLVTLTRWKQEIAEGTRVGPRLFVAGPALDAAAGERCKTDALHHICIGTPSEARLAVDFLKLAGADFIKTYILSRELYFAIATEARRVGIPFGGHVYDMHGLEASDSGARFLDHLTWFNPNVCADPNSDFPAAYDPAQCRAAIERLRRNNTWIVESAGYGWNVFPRRIYERWGRFVPDSVMPGLKTMLTAAVAAWDSLAPGLPSRPSALADWKAALQSPAARDLPHFRDYTKVKGLPIVAGTDVVRYATVAGLGLHETLVTFVLHGMTPLEALQTATLNPALALQATDSLGTVAAGKLADLVLLDADPLLDIANTQQIRAVIANGRYYDRAALNQLMVRAERAVH